MIELTRERFWWAVHNLVAHPLWEVLFWIGFGHIGDWLHDGTAQLAKEARGDA